MPYFVWDSPTLEIYDNDDNLLASITDDPATLIPDDEGFLHFQACMSEDDIFTATIWDDHDHSICVSEQTEPSAQGFWASLGGDTGAQFKDFRFEKYRSTTEPTDAGCDTCRCSSVCDQCLNRAGPALVKVVLPVEIDDCIVAEGCELPQSGTRILDNITDPIGGGVNPCAYGAWFNENCHVRVFFYGPGMGYVNGDPAPDTYRVTIEYSGFGLTDLYARWELDLGEEGPIPCLDYEDTPIPWKETIGGVLCPEQEFPPVYLTSL